MGITLFLVGWIFHNIRIARVKHRRKSRVRDMGTPDADFLGRRVVIEDEAELKKSRYVEVHITHAEAGDEDAKESKFFQPASDLPLDS